MYITFQETEFSLDKFYFQFFFFNLLINIENKQRKTITFFLKTIMKISLDYVLNFLKHIRFIGLLY